MAVFSRRVVLLILGALVLLSIAVRYPLVEHERFQTDSYTMHYLAKAISDDGYAKWTFHPLSYIGYYPYSYPSGVPFLLAELSETTGLSIETSVLVASAGLGVLFCLSVFVLARCFVSRLDYILLITFFSTLGVRFVDTTYWDGSARAPMVVLVILIVFSSFRASQLGQRRLLIPAFFFVIGCLATHHMAVLLVLFGVAYLIAVFEVEFVQKRVLLRKRSSVTASNLAMLAIIMLVAFGLFEYFRDLTFMNLRTSEIFDVDPPLLSVILNVGVAYTSQIGLITIFAVLALPDLFARRRISITALYPVTLFLVFLPLLGNPLYVSMLLCPFIVILGSVYMVRRAGRPRFRRAWIGAIGAVMVISLVLPTMASIRWNGEQYIGGEKVQVDSQVYSDSEYLTVYYADTFGICNVKTLRVKLAALTDTDFLAGGIPRVISGNITRENIPKPSWSDAPFPTNLYTWFEDPNERTAESHVRALMVNGVFIANGNSRDFFDDHPKLLVVMENENSNNYVDDYSVAHSAMAEELLTSTWIVQPSVRGSFFSYAIYASEKTTVYAVQLPT